jgi:hypothetical protein
MASIGIHQCKDASEAEQKLIAAHTAVEYKLAEHMAVAVEVALVSRVAEHMSAGYHMAAAAAAAFPAARKAAWEFPFDILHILPASANLVQHHWTVLLSASCSIPGFLERGSQ